MLISFWKPVQQLFIIATKNIALILLLTVSYIFFFCLFVLNGLKTWIKRLVVSVVTSSDRGQRPLLCPTDVNSHYLGAQ